MSFEFHASVASRLTALTCIVTAFLATIALGEAFLHVRSSRQAGK